MIDGILIQRSIALFSMSAQAELTVGAVATQTTCMFWRNGVNCFLVHSFLVSPQIAFCCRIIAACTLSSFEVTRKTPVFSMCVAHVDCQVIFVSEYLVTDSARRLNCVVDSPVAATQSAFGHELFATNVANIITTHFCRNMWCLVPYMPST